MKAMTNVMRGALCIILIAIAGCTGLSARVDRGALADVPNEELLVLFDAENGVYIARDEADHASRHLEDARAALVKARAYREVITRRRTSGATIDSVPVLDLLGHWNDARIAMREAELELRNLEVATSDIKLWTARARYELEKARLVKDKNPAVGKDIELARFEEQATIWQAREAEAATEVAERTAVVVKARALYFALSRQLQEQSGGAYGGPWADLLD